MSLPLITLTGPPGSGKSTAGRRAAERLGLEFHSAGDLFRAEAARHGLSLAEFGVYAEQHDEVDRALDERMLALARPGRLLDGRLTGALCRRRGIPARQGLVTADARVRAERLAHRDGVTVEEARRRMVDREASERDRYRRYYGIDLASEPAEFVVDTTAMSPEAVVAALVDWLEGHRGPG